MNKTKKSNPKEAMSDGKVPIHCVPTKPLLEVGLAMMEGGRKYGTHNYRDCGVRMSTYYNACMRHLMSWWEGENTDPDSGVPHLIKAIACLFVVRDSIHMGNCTDDRPIKYPVGINMGVVNQMAANLIDQYPDCVPPFTELTHGESAVKPLPDECKVCGTIGRFHCPPNCSEHDGSKEEVAAPAPAGTFKDRIAEAEPGESAVRRHGKTEKKVTPGSYRMQITAVDIIEPSDQKIGKTPKYYVLAAGTPVKIELQDGCNSKETVNKCRQNDWEGQYKRPYSTGSMLHIIAVGDKTVDLYESEFKEILV